MAATGKGHRVAPSTRPAKSADFNHGTKPASTTNQAGNQLNYQQQAAKPDVKFRSSLGCKVSQILCPRVAPTAARSRSRGEWSRTQQTEAMRSCEAEGKEGTRVARP